MFSIFLLGFAISACHAQEARGTQSTSDIAAQKALAMNQSKYVGMWVTADGHIRHELLPGGRYDEARGARKSAYQGSYRMAGDHIEYRDDTGFTADGDFRDGVLYHAGMVLYREKRPTEKE
jgi:hypothetical protein